MSTGRDPHLTTDASRLATFTPGQLNVAPGPQGPVHGPVHAEPRAGARQGLLGQRDLHLQALGQHLRQRPGQQTRRRPGMANTTGSRSPRISGQTVELYSIKWSGLQRRRRRRRRGRRLDRHELRFPGHEHAGLSTGPRPSGTTRATSSSSTRDIRTAGRPWPRSSISHSSGMANRIIRQDMNFEGPMVTDNNWMSTLNYTINNMTGPLPFTPKLRVQALRLLHHPLGRARPRRPLPDALGPSRLAAGGIPRPHAVGNSSGQRHHPRGRHRLVVRDTKPEYLPAQAILDFRLEKTFKLGQVRLLQRHPRRLQPLQLEHPDQHRLPVGIRTDRLHPQLPDIPAELHVPVLDSVHAEPRSPEGRRPPGFFFLRSGPYMWNRPDSANLSRTREWLK